jgi:hypothetical protein
LGSIFEKAAKEFGRYNNLQNHTNNPVIFPYYGEIPYSGRAIASGFFNWSNSEIIQNWGTNAVYGNIKIK